LPIFCPHAARAQQAERVRRIGVLNGLAETDPEGQARVASFQKGLQDLGWKDGGNVQIEYRWAGGDPARLRAYAAELVGLKPNVILAAAASALRPLQRETLTIPIVFAQVTDPVALGFVASLARPGGNITGFATSEHGLAGKWMELLKQIAPGVTRVCAIYQPGTPQTAGLLREIGAAARSFDVELSTVAVRDATEIKRAVGVFARQPNSGLIIPPSPLIATHRDMIIELAERQRLPVVYPYRYFVTRGGLTSYGPDNHDLYQRAASYVDRILKGEKPSDLPVQLPTKYELVLNLKTAKALGLAVPATVLLRADEVIE
jgi:putative ABC transport system substrate-binding protein